MIPELERRIGFWRVCLQKYEELQVRMPVKRFLRKFGEEVRVPFHTIDVIYNTPHIASLYVDEDGFGDVESEGRAATLVGGSVEEIYRLADERIALEKEERAQAAERQRQQEREAKKEVRQSEDEEKRKWLDRPEKEILWELHQRLLSLEGRVRKVEFSTAIIGD